MYDKFKGLLTDDGVFYGLILTLVALSSFGLGRIAGRETLPEAAPATVAFTQQMPDTGESSMPHADTASSTAQLVGSKNGTKYHALRCPGASQIKEENKVFFASKEEAQKAGYTPASNCKGI